MANRKIDLELLDDNLKLMIMAGNVIPVAYTYVSTGTNPNLYGTVKVLDTVHQGEYYVWNETTLAWDYMGKEESNGTADWNTLANKPTSFPPSTHTHTESDIPGLDKYTKAQVDAKIANLDIGAINVKTYGAKGDGVTNDAPAIRSAIAALPSDGGVLIFPKGTYLLGNGSSPHYTNVSGKYGGTATIGTDNSLSFNGKTNLTIRGNGSTIKSHTANSCIINNRIFDFFKCDNLVMQDLVIDGSKNNRAPWGGDGSAYNLQHNINIDACKRVTLRNVRSNNSVMDGLMIQSSTLFANQNIWSEDILIENCQFNNAYRQGISVVNAKRVVVRNTECSYTGTTYGTSPMAGIDFEEGFDSPYGRGQSDCLVDGCRFTGNVGDGVALHYGTHDSIVQNSVFRDNNIFSPEEGGFLTVNNSVLNNTFYDAGVHMNGGGSLIEGNVFYITYNDFSIRCSDVENAYLNGKARVNKVINNTIKFETITPVVNRGLFLVWSKAAIVEGNTFINLNAATVGDYCLTVDQGVESFSENTFIYTLDQNVTPICLLDILATRMENNIVPNRYNLSNPLGVGGGGVETPVDIALKKQDTDIDDTERLQRAIDYCHGNNVPLILDGGQYYVRSLSVREGTVIHGNGAIFKKPNLKIAPYNYDDETIKWVRMINVEGYSNSRVSHDVTVIEGIIFDGSAWDIWSTPSYLYEQSALIFATADYDDTNTEKRLRLTVTNCTFMNSIGDGIHISYGVMANISNIHTYDCFRGGIVFTAGNTVANIDNCILQGDRVSDGIDFEVDFRSDLGLKINLNNIQMKSAELDIQVPENSSLYINNLVMTGSVKGYTTMACGNNSILKMSNSTILLNHAGSSESRLMLDGDAQFDNVKFISADTSDSVFYVWVAPYDSSVKNVSATFESCVFDNIVGTQAPQGLLTTQLMTVNTSFMLKVNNCTFTKNLGSVLKTNGGDMDFDNNSIYCGVNAWSNITVDTYWSHFTSKYFTINIRNNRIYQKAQGILLNLSGYMTKVFFENVYHNASDYQSSSFTVLPWNATGGDVARTNMYVSKSTIFSPVAPPTCPVMLGDTAICHDGKVYEGKLVGSSVQWVLGGSGGGSIDAYTKTESDNTFLKKSKLTVSTTQPSSPTTNDIWIQI